MNIRQLFSSLFLVTLVFVGCGSNSKDNSTVASNISTPLSDINKSVEDNQTNRVTVEDNQEVNSSESVSVVDDRVIYDVSNTYSDTSSSSKVSGRVIDGELIYATVFLDLNRNRLLDSNEPKAKSDENGDYSLEISSEAKSHENYINKTAPLVSIGGFDKKSKKEFVGTFTAPFSEDNPNITPITTLINEMLEANRTQTLDDIKSKLAKSLNISAEDLMKDPVELAKVGDATLLELSLKIHQSSEVLSKSLVDKKESIEVYALMARELNGDEVSLDVALKNTVDKNSDSFDSDLVETSKVAVEELNRNISELFDNHADDFGTDSTVVTEIALTLDRTQNQIVDAVNRNQADEIESVTWRDNVIDDVSKEIVRQLLLIVGYQNEDDIADIAKFNSIDDDLTLESLKVLLEADGNYPHIIDIIDEKLKDLKEDKGNNSEDVEITESVENLSIKQIRNADWNSGFCEEIEVKNISNSSLKWQVKVSVNGIINNLWSANYSQDSETHELTASGVSWNSILNPNQSTIFGYCATKTAESSLGEDSSSDSSRLVVTQSRESDWNSGFCEKVKVTNSEDKKISNWEISFDVEGIINNLWSANYTQDENLKVTASGLSWNRDVPANGSVEFGYCATKVATSSNPDEVAVQKDSESLTFNSIKLDNSVEDRIVGALNLITTGANGSTITWESNNSAISSSGVVTQPEIGKADIKVELLAVIKKGQYRKTKRFNLTVLAKQGTTPPPTPTDELFSEFNVGFGGSSSFPFASTTDGEKIWVSAKNLVLDNDIANNNYYANIKDFNGSAFSKLQQHLQNSKFITFWFVEGWEESWYNLDSIQELMDKGYVPVFSYWYFGDKLINGMPSEQKREDYAQDNIRVADLLAKLNGKKIIIMEPEFNKRDVIKDEATQHDFASIISNAIDTIKAKNSDLLVTLSMMDTGSRGVTNTASKCGYSNCSLGDNYAWGQPEIIFNDLLDKLDFVSFHQMIGQFSRDPSDAGDWDNPNPKAYSDDEVGIDFLAERISNFSKFLQEKYNKPVFLPYIAVATATWSDDNANGEIEESEVDKHGWDNKADQTYKKLSEMKSTLLSNGLFGFAPMALFDNPRHDYGGYQFFMNNEYHLGLVGSSAVDEIDIASYGDLNFKMDVLSHIFGGVVDTPPSAKSKYHDVLGLSLKFYEAQRDVGPFPTVDWRKPASINDGSDVGVDLNGGWFDAGDHVKFNLPMSYSVSMLNWSMISTPQAYTQAGKLDYGKEQVKYALDYLLNAYQAGSDLDSPADDKVYFQVADGHTDHNFWGPPEELNMDRPTFTCDSDGGCAAVSGTMVASFASGAILFADDTTYSQRLLDSAKRLHKFAMTYPTDNDYSSVGQDFYKLYDSSNEDQIAWGAIWLYRATHDVQYLNDAKSLVEGKYPWAQSWDNMFLGVFELLAEETNDNSYKDRVKNELNAWINKDVPTTQGGLRVRLEWGSLRYSTAVSFISLMYSDLLDSDAEKEPYINFAKSQIDYALGDNPQNFSYVVGYGDNYPTHPHHRGASGTTKEDSNPNKYVIEGALVGGPMSADDSDYQDIRDGEIAWKCNEVTTDYNAGFTGALAKLALLYGEPATP